MMSALLYTSNKYMTIMQCIIVDISLNSHAAAGLDLVETTVVGGNMTWIHLVLLVWLSSSLI